MELQALAQPEQPDQTDEPDKPDQPDKPNEPDHFISRFFCISRFSRVSRMKNAFTFELNFRIMTYEDVTPIPFPTYLQKEAQMKIAEIMKSAC